jgi:hypothetical protein
MDTQDETVPPASVEQGAESQPAPAAEEKPTFDTQAILDKVKDVFLPEEPEPPKEEPKASETPPAPDAATPEAKAPEEAPEPTVVDENDEDALVQDPQELDRKDPRFEKIGKRLDRLREKNAALRQDAAFGSTLVKMAKDGNMSPDQLAWWNALGVRANMGDPQAIQEMAGVLQGLGWKPPQSAPDPISGALDATAEKIYQEVFSDDVKNLNIDEDLAKAKARKLAERELAGRTPQPPPPQHVQQYQPPAQVPPQQPQRQADPLASAVAHSLHERQQRFAASIPGFDQINAEVVKRIKALGPEKVPLIDRPSHYEALVLQVQRERAATKRTPPPSTGLRSSTMAAPNKSSTKEKILNDPEIWGQ